MDIKDCCYIGYISKTRGLKGEVQLFFEFEDYKELTLDVLFLEIDKKLVPFFVEQVKVLDNRTAYLFLEDVQHIDQAQPLLRRQVYLPLDHMPERDPDDFRYTDLQGYVVHDQQHGVLGPITEVHEYPQQWVAAVQYQEKEVLFPLNEETMVRIDPSNLVLEVALPDGLVDLYIGG